MTALLQSTRNDIMCIHLQLGELGTKVQGPWTLRCSSCGGMTGKCARCNIQWHGQARKGARMHLGPPLASSECAQPRGWDRPSCIPAPCRACPGHCMLQRAHLPVIPPHELHLTDDPQLTTCRQELLRADGQEQSCSASPPSVQRRVTLKLSKVLSSSTALQKSSVHLLGLSNFFLQAQEVHQA